MWLNGQRAGHGQEFDSSGNLDYEGGFENDARNGNGSQFVNGKILYVGSFVDGLKDGHGIVIFDDLSHFVAGRWDDHLSGAGSYVGQWKHNRMEGNGIMVSRAPLQVYVSQADGWLL